MAPEVISQDDMGYNSAADIWSLGITALELAYGYPPYAKQRPLKAMMDTLDGKPPSPESYNNPQRTQLISPGFRKFISRCLVKDPAKRPRASELLSGTVPTAPHRTVR